MNPFEMVVIIVLIVFGARLFRSYFQMKQNQQANAMSEQDISRMKAEVDRLKDRVRVLEEIVTDKDHHLAEEIRKLA